MADTALFNVIDGDLMVAEDGSELTFTAKGQVLVFKTFVELNGLDLWYTDENVDGWSYYESKN
mgnify:CR=1 FL=1